MQKQSIFSWWVGVGVREVEMCSHGSYCAPDSSAWHLPRMGCARSGDNTYMLRCRHFINNDTDTCICFCTFYGFVEELLLLSIPDLDTYYMPAAPRSAWGKNEKKMKKTRVFNSPPSPKVASCRPLFSLLLFRRLVSVRKTHNNVCP